MRNPEARMNRVPGRSAGVERGSASGETPPDERGRRPREVRMWRGAMSRGHRRTRGYPPRLPRRLARAEKALEPPRCGGADRRAAVARRRGSPGGRERWPTSHRLSLMPHWPTSRTRPQCQLGDDPSVPVRRRARIEHDLHDRYRPPRARNAIPKRAVASRCGRDGYRSGHDGSRCCRGGSRCGRGGLVGDRHGSAVGAVPGYWSSAGSRAAALQ